MRARAVVFDAEGLDLEGEIVLPDAGARAAVVLCHGIPSGRTPDPDDTGYAGLARTIAAAGFAAMWFNFRGCKGAPGDFSMPGWCADLRAALDRLATFEPAAGLPVVVAGSSAGGAVAISVAATRPDVAAVATLAAPASFGDLVADQERFLQDMRNAGVIRDPGFPRDPQGWWAGFAETAAEEHVAALGPRPLLLVHGDADDVVPYPHAERLFARAGPPKELVRLERGGHQLRRDPRALDAVVDWLERWRATMPPTTQIGGMEPAFR